MLGIFIVIVYFLVEVRSTVVVVGVFVAVADVAVVVKSALLDVAVPEYPSSTVFHFGA